MRLTISINQELAEAIAANQESDLIQKEAWRLVRSAEDRMRDGRGNEQLLWCVNRLRAKHPGISAEDAEDFIRAAWCNFRIEKTSLEDRRVI